MSLLDLAFIPLCNGILCSIFKYTVGIILIDFNVIVLVNTEIFHCPLTVHKS